MHGFLTSAKWPFNDFLLEQAGYPYYGYSSILVEIEPAIRHL